MSLTFDHIPPVKPGQNLRQAISADRLNGGIVLQETLRDHVRNNLGMPSTPPPRTVVVHRAAYIVANPDGDDPTDATYYIKFAAPDPSIRSDDQLKLVEETLPEFRGVVLATNAAEVVFNEDGDITDGTHLLQHGQPVHAWLLRCRGGTQTPHWVFWLAPPAPMLVRLEMDGGDLGSHGVPPTATYTVKSDDGLTTLATGVTVRGRREPEQCAAATWGLYRKIRNVDVLTVGDEKPMVWDCDAGVLIEPPATPFPTGGGSGSGFGSGFGLSFGV